METGTEQVIRYFTASEDQGLFVSVLAALEARSAIRRLQSQGDLDADSAELALSILVQETGRIIEHPITAPVVAEAARMVERHQLRALDALQLGTALIARIGARTGSAVLFIASDRRLLLAAEAEGFRVWNPQTQELSVVE